MERMKIRHQFFLSEGLYLEEILEILLRNFDNQIRFM